MSTAQYCITSSPATFIVGAIRLTDRSVFLESCKNKAQTAFSAQHYVVIAHPHRVHFYLIHSAPNVAGGFSASSEHALPPERPETSESLEPLPAPAFSVSFHADIERVQRWSPPLPSASAIDALISAHPEHRREVLLLFQEGLLLFTHTATLYLVIPDYASGTVECISQVSLYDSWGYRNHQEVLMAVDPQCRFVCIHLYRMTLKLVSVRQKRSAKSRQPGSPRVWHLDLGPTLSIPNIYPVGLAFAASSAGSWYMPGESAWKRSYTETLSSRGVGVAAEKATPRIKRRKASNSRELRTTVTRDGSAFETTLRDGKSHSDILPPCLVILCDPQPGDAAKPPVRHAPRLLHIVNVVAAVTPESTGTAVEPTHYRASPTTSLVFGAVNGFCLVGAGEVMFYSLKTKARPTSDGSQTKFILGMRPLVVTFSSSQTLQAPLVASPVDADGGSLWIVGDAAGSLMILALHSSNEENEGNAVLPVVQDIVVTFLSKRIPVSCLLAFRLYLCHKPSSAVCSETTAGRSSFKHGSGLFDNDRLWLSQRVNGADLVDTLKSRRPSFWEFALLIGSRTGNGAVFTLRIGKNGFQSIGAIEALYNIPHLGPIVDFAPLEPFCFPGQRLQFVLASGYAETGALQLVSPGMSVSRNFLSFKDHPVSGFGSRFFSVFCTINSTEAFSSVVIFETSLLATRLWRLTPQGGSLLSFELWTDAPGYLAVPNLLWVGNDPSLQAIFQITAEELLIYTKQDFSVLHRVTYQDVLGHPFFAEHGVFEDSLAVLASGPHLRAFSFKRSDPRHPRVACYTLAEEVACLALNADATVLVVADWQNRLTLFKVEEKNTHTPEDGSLYMRLIRSRTLVEELEAFNCFRKDVLSQPISVTGIFLHPLTLTTFSKSFTKSSVSSEQFAKELGTESDCPAFVGLSNGTVLCFVLRPFSDTSTESPSLNLKQVMQVGASPVTFQPVLSRRRPFSTEPGRHGLAALGVVAVCNTPALLFLDRLRRFRSTVMGLSGGARCLVCLHANILEMLTKTSLLQSSGVQFVAQAAADSAYSPLAPLRGGRSVLDSQGTFMVLWIPLVFQPGQQHANSLCLGKVNGIQALQITTVPLGVSPDRVVLHKKTRLIVAGCVDGEEHYGSLPSGEGGVGFRTASTLPRSPVGCLMLYDTQTGHPPMRYDLSGEEYVSSLLCCHVGDDPRELLVVGSVLGPPACKGCLRLYQLDKTPSAQSSVTASVGDGTDAGDRPLPVVYCLASQSTEPVTAVRDVKRFLVVAFNNTVAVVTVVVDHHLRRPGPECSPHFSKPLSFQFLATFTAPSFVHSIDAIDNLVLMGFVSRSAGLYALTGVKTSHGEQNLSFSETPRKDTDVVLNEVSVDYGPSMSTAVCCSSTRDFLVADEAMNLVVLSLEAAHCAKPVEGAAVDGLGQPVDAQELEAIATFHMGESIHCLVPYCEPYDSTHGAACKTFRRAEHPSSLRSDVPERRSNVLWASTQGALGALLPLDKKEYTRLSLVETALAEAIKDPLGIEHAAYRNPSSLVWDSRSNKGRRRGFIDGDFVEIILELARSEQERVFAILSQAEGFHSPTPLYHNLEELLADVEHFQRRHC